MSTQVQGFGSCALRARRGGRLPAPFAGAVEGARAGLEPHYGHYSLHVSLVAIFARDVEQTNPLLTGGLRRLRGLAHDANRVAQAHVSRPPRLPLRPFA